MSTGIALASGKNPVVGDEEGHSDGPGEEVATKEVFFFSSMSMPILLINLCLGKLQPK